MPVPQDHSAAPLAPILPREDGRLRFERSAAEVYNRWRGFQPWPGAWTLLDGKKLTVSRMGAPIGSSGAKPGTLFAQDGRLFAACATGAVAWEEVQLEGKRAIEAEAFLRGRPELLGKQLI